MENKLMKRTGYYYFGFICIFIGVGIFIELFVAFFSKETNNIKGLMDIHFGLIGLFFGLGTIFLNLDNLNIQRLTLLQQQASIDQQKTSIDLQREDIKVQTEEIKISNEYFKQQNEALLSQQYQTTFFNLLEAHTQLVFTLEFNSKLGFEGLNSFYKLLVSEVDSFQNVLKNDFTFQSVSDTSRNPINTILKNKHSIESLFSDLKTIIEVIENKLQKDKIYYRILYNYLSVYEKFLIGLYCDCINDDYSTYFNKNEFDFKKFYQKHKSKYKLTEETYFPTLNIWIANRQGTYLLENLTTRGAFDFNVIPVLDFLESQIDIKRVSIAFTRGSNYLFHAEELSKDEIKRNYTKKGFCILLNEAMITGFRKAENENFFSVEIIFCFQYFANFFSVKLHISMRKEIFQEQLIGLINSKPYTRLVINSITELGNYGYEL